MHHARTLLTVAIALVAFVAAIGRADAARLVGNTGERWCFIVPVGEAGKGNDHGVAQRFTTGPAARTLKSIEVDVCSFGATLFAGGPLADKSVDVEVWTHDGETGEPARRLYALSGGIDSTGYVAFQAPAGSVLEANTSYWVVLNAEDGLFRIKAATTGREDGDGAAGWQLHNGRLDRSHDSGPWVRSGHPVRIAIHGSADMSDGIDVLSAEAKTHRRVVITAADPLPPNVCTEPVFSGLFLVTKDDFAVDRQREIPLTAAHRTCSGTTITIDIPATGAHTIRNDDLISVDLGMTGVVRGPVGPRPTGEDVESLQVTNRLPRFTIYYEDDFSEVVADVVEGAMLVSAPPVTAGGHGPLTWTLEGADAGHFTIDAQTGVFTFTAPDHEPPADLDGDNEYRAVVFATDPHGDSDSIRIRITVKDGPDLHE